MAGNLTDKYKVPAGLRPLLEAFARETIRTQPDDLVRFGQVFFDVLRVHKSRKFDFIHFLHLSFAVARELIFGSTYTYLEIS